ncbi:MAG: Hpt domain-containing protein [Chlorobiaceae bacterium]|nr:Hpt domain-containing protein [Chlorobiaceae bacterium]
MTDTLVVDIDRDLENLIPEYLQGRRQDIDAMKGALQTGDFETMMILGHNMKGTGGGYGFNAITDIGSKIQQAAIAKNAGELEKLAGILQDYLDRITIRHV